MMGPLLFPVTLCAALGCGLNGGVFFAFSSFVMKALTRLPPARGIAAMNSISVVAVTPVYMSALFGTGLLCALLGVHALLAWERPGQAYILMGSLLYVLGAIAVTMVFNVPQNNALAGLEASNENAALWTQYVDGWSVWNHVRTISSTGAGALLILGLLKSR